MKRVQERFEVTYEHARAMGLDKLVDYVEYWIIRIAMKRAGGNAAQAARLLKINRTALFYKRKKYGMPTGRGDRSGRGH